MMKRTSLERAYMKGQMLTGMKNQSACSGSAVRAPLLKRRCQNKWGVGLSRRKVFTLHMEVQMKTEYRM